MTGVQTCALPIYFEYENSNNFASQKLNKDIITVYIPAEQQDLHISSSAVRILQNFGKDYSGYVPEKILPDLQKLLK